MFSSIHLVSPYFFPLMLEAFLGPQEINTLKRLSPRQLSLRLVAASYSVISTYMLWKLIGIILSNDSPIVVVLSESMYPGFERGDILFLSPKKYEDYVVGDMTVFQMNKNEIPIVHRCIKRFDDKILTKGDNNRYDDVSLYRRGQYYLTEGDVLSRVIACLPFFGMITIWINSVPALRFIAMFFIGLGVFLSVDE